MRQELKHNFLAPDTQAGGMALAPPFVMSTAISPVGLMAAGTADGRLWVGWGGQKVPGKKKARKWGGLKGEESITIKIAEGPLVGMYVLAQIRILNPHQWKNLRAFDELGILTITTLLGVVSRHTLVWDENERSIQVEKISQKETQRIQKVNDLIVEKERIIIGGLTGQGSGALEIWKRSS